MFFIADLIDCSTRFRHHYAHHQELESIIQLVAGCIWCFGFQVVGMVWSWGLCLRFAGCCPVVMLESSSFLPTVHVMPRCRSPNPCLPQQQDTIPYAVKYLSLALLKMGKCLPETCWADLGDQ